MGYTHYSLSETSEYAISDQYVATYVKMCKEGTSPLPIRRSSGFEETVTIYSILKDFNQETGELTRREKVLRFYMFDGKKETKILEGDLSDHLDALLCLPPEYLRVIGIQNEVS